MLTRTGEKVPLSVLIVSTIAIPLQNVMQTHIAQLPHLQGLSLAHPVTKPATTFEISLLIGADYYWDIVENHIIRGNGPTAMNSNTGYLLSGPLSPQQTSALNILNVTIQYIDTDSGDLQRFWAIESTGTSSVIDSDSDKTFLQSYIDSSITCQPNGSYIARFPWKVDHPPLPTNHKTCERRTRSLVCRLVQTPDLLQTYNNIITDQEKRGFFERVLSPQPSDSCHYIPHHAVRKDSPTTPIRIVYDCSCHQSKESPSLNDCLMMGPPFLNDLCSIIIRFRIHTFGISTDIEKAFLHVQLHEDNRDFTRFLWLSDPLNPNSELQVYRFKVVLFGATSSPFMLNATLHHLQQFNSPIAVSMLTNLYVDNVISGCNSHDQAIQYYQKARSIMSDANFNLRAWASNCPQLSTLAKQDKIADENTTVNILGLQWNTATDTLSFPSQTIIPDNTTLITKRECLQQSSKIFNPLGFLSPVTIRAKLFMQSLWQKHIDWDEPLEKDLRDEWLIIAKDIQVATTVTMPRQYFTNADLSSTAAQLHVFADASIKAYGAVAYLQVNEQMAFVIAKTRVAPVKELTLPKLELMAALIAARVSNFIATSLSLQGISTYLWADSQIVLYWIHSNKKLPTFVAHRINEIRQLTSTAAWRYCPTESNPADLLTRGINSQLLTSSTLWSYGPSWITSGENHWPTWQPSSSLQMLAATATAEEFTPIPPSQVTNGLHCIINLSNYSSFDKLIAITTYVYRFITNLKSPSKKQHGPLTATELYQAKMC